MADVVVLNMPAVYTTIFFVFVFLMSFNQPFNQIIQTQYMKKH